LPQLEAANQLQNLQNFKKQETIASMQKSALEECFYV